MNPSLTEVLSADIDDLKQRYDDKSIALFLLDDEMLARQDVRIANAVLAFFNSTKTYRGTKLDQIVQYKSEFRDAFLASPIVRTGAVRCPLA